MLTLTPEITTPPEPELESAGQMHDGKGPEVLCNVVTAEGYAAADTVAIVMGCGAKAVHYADFQVELARQGINSVCTERLYRVSRHPVRMQAEAVEHALTYAQEEHGLVARTAYGHSWGGVILASLLNHDPGDIDLGIFHATAGFEKPFRNMALRPSHFVRGLQRGLLRRAQLGDTQSSSMIYPSFTQNELAALSQHMLAAAEGRKFVSHLESARKAGVFVAGLWAEHDLFFHRQHHPLFDENERLEGSVHTETQSNPRGVAMAVSKQITEHKVRKAAKTESLPIAVAGG